MVILFLSRKLNFIRFLKSICFPQKFIWGGVETNMKKSVSVKEIQNCRGKQCFAISSGCFSPLGGFNVKSFTFESIARWCFFYCYRNCLWKKFHFRLALLPVQFKCIHKETKCTWVTTFQHPLAPLLISRSLGVVATTCLFIFPYLWECN